MIAVTNHRNPRVLVVDDERIIADTLAMILCNARYDARAAYSGSMAIQMARNFHPDLLITDVVMPGISGIKTAIQMREMFPSCKILLFSGNEATVGLLEMARLQNREFELLAKPIHPADLIAKLRNVNCRSLRITERARDWSGGVRAATGL